MMGPYDFFMASHVPQFSHKSGRDINLFDGANLTWPDDGDNDNEDD